MYAIFDYESEDIFLCRDTFNNKKYNKDCSTSAINFEQCHTS